MDKLNPWQVDYTPRPRGPRPSRKAKLKEIALWALAGFVIMLIVLTATGCGAEPVAVDPSEASSGWFEVQETPAQIIPAPAPIGKN